MKQDWECQSNFKIASDWQYIQKNNNICTVQSESSTFASLLFDQGAQKNARLQCHLADWNAIWQYFASIQLLFIIIDIKNTGRKIQLTSRNLYVRTWADIHFAIEIYCRQRCCHNFKSERLIAIHTWSLSLSVLFSQFLYFINLQGRWK